jgi:A/G-specific adenine glycosylase
MELGSIICTSTHPACQKCPVRSLCPTQIAKLQHQIPAKTRKLKYENVREAVVLIRRGPRLLMRRCDHGQRWAGLWDFPRFKYNGDSTEWHLSSSIERDCGLSVSLQPLNSTMKHTVTRFRITLHCFVASRVSGRLRTGNGHQWKTEKQIQTLPLSATGRSIARRLGELTD